ncbi:BTB/POZ and MATH domain-containing protein 1-like [Brachypodium distachyon]|uniref:BTB/POZ and MATH domain-containing protein 1-like n=1 Tax=Brachypodium distachyon TaxID=15368 RepID=UPI000D0E0C95|nr:BTB/POZ and MATH domain-containing protein 1-like [Brachypodium distachyon]|eukprot:XP_024317149.1 BTB/POZ and MATH domain-containing protein 1-like [Brachypodium distachyon]
MAAAVATARKTLEIKFHRFNFNPLPLFVMQPSPPNPKWTSTEVFAAGGYEWRAHVVRNLQSYSAAEQSSTGFYLQLVTKNARATAALEICLLDNTGRLLPRKALCMTPTEFDSTDIAAAGRTGRNHTLGALVPDSHLDMSLFGYLDLPRDRLLVEITVTVFSDKPPSKTSAAAGAMPPSDLMEQLGELLATRDEGGDVVFSLEGQPSIEIEGMTRDVFEALLAYIYTDSLPAGAGDEDASGGGGVMVWDLLVAADRYGVDRLRAICERLLCGKLDVQNVARFLGVADQYHLHALKEACIEFMTTSARMDEIVQTQEYAELRANRLHLLAEVLEKSTKFRLVPTH